MHFLLHRRAVAILKQENLVVSLNWKFVSICFLNKKGMSLKVFLEKICVYTTL